MKKVENKKSRKPLTIGLITLGLIVILVLIAFFFYPGLKDRSPANQKTSSGTTSDINTSKGQSQTDTSIVDPNKTTNQVPVNNTAAASITKLEQDKSGNILFSASVTGADQGGKCTVSFTNPNDKPYTLDAFIGTSQGNSVVCGPLAISNLNFSLLGTWDVTFRYYVNNQQVTTSSKIDIEQ